MTIMYQSEELDAGDLILQREVVIHPDETAGELATRLAELGAALLVEAVDLIAQGTAPRQPQDHAHATYAGRMTKTDGALHWSRPARDLANQVRAVTPWPGAYTRWRGGRLTVWRARVGGAPPGGEGHVAAAPGLVVGADSGGITVACGDGVLVLLDLQPAGGRRMPAAEFLRGHRLQPGERLGEAAAASPRPEMVE
jgi:methionyl-tRNA formyltransferase